MTPTILLCLVVAITDGDTIKARCGQAGAYDQITVRISAIDAPESRQAFGQRSKQHLSDLCFHQQAIVTPKATDKYGRTVGDVECQGRDVATEQVRAGMAWYYVKYGKGYEHLQAVEHAARQAGRGLWSMHAEPPWEWRKQSTKGGHIVTTVAFDGKTMAADTLAVDAWGMREVVTDKIWQNPQLLIGCAGESGQIRQWLNMLGPETDIKRLVREGYVFFNKENNDPALMVVDRATGRIYRHAGGSFLPSHYTKFAVGSGRDFAIAAMHLGKCAREAVAVAAHFDNNTGADIVEVVIKVVSDPTAKGDKP